MRKTVSFTLDVPDELLDNEPLLRDWLRRRARRICDQTMLALCTPEPPQEKRSIDLEMAKRPQPTWNPDRDNSI